MADTVQPPTELPAPEPPPTPTVERRPMTFGVALGALVTLAVVVVVVYAATIYLSLLTSFGGAADTEPSWVDAMLRLGPPVVVLALAFGVVSGFARRTGRGSVRSWVMTTAALSVPLAVIAVVVVQDPAVILPVLVWLALWAGASAVGARAGLRAVTTRRRRAARSPDAVGSTP